MPGKIKQMIDTIIKQKSGGNAAVEDSTKVKIILKGVIVTKYTDNSDDDPVVIAKLQGIAKEMGVTL